MSNNVGSLFFDAGITTQRLFNDATAIERRIGAIGNSAGTAGNDAGRMFSTGFTSSIASIIGAAGIGALLTKIVGDAKTFADEFKSTLKEVETISPAVAAGFEEIGQKVMDISIIGIKDDAVELNKALYQIVSAGYDGAAGLKVLEASAKGATAGVTETQTVADGLTTVMNAWGESVENVDAVSDKMFTTVRLGKTTMGELSSQIAQVAPLASSFGISMDEVFAAVASLTKQGVPTAQAMTQIRSSIINLNKTLGDGWTDTMTYQEGMNKVAEMSGGSATKLRELIPDVEATNAILGLTGEKAAGAASDLEAMRNSTGAAAAAFEVMTDTAEVQMNTLQNHIKRLMAGFGSDLADGIGDVVKDINQAFEDGSIDTYFDNLAKVIKVAAALMVVFNASTIASTTSLLAQEFALKALIIQEEVLTRWTKISAAAQAAFNATAGGTAGVLNVVKVAMNSLKAAMISNPFTAIIAVVGIAAGAFMAFRDKVKSAKEMQEDFNRLQKDTSENQSLSAMIERYNDLSKEQSLSNTEQAEYNALIKKLAEVYPTAIDQMNSHGEVIGLNTEKMRQMNGVQKQALDILAKDQLSDAEEALTKLQSKLQNAQRGMENWSKAQKTAASEDGFEKSNKNLTKFAAKVNELSKEETELLSTVNGLRKQLGMEPVGVKVEIDASANPNNTESTDKVKAEAKATVSAQIKSINAEIIAKQKELKSLRVSTSTATPEEIEETEKQIKALKDRLEQLTGASGKKKDQDIITEQERLKALEELGKMQVEMQRKIEEGRIAAMEEGKQKRIAEAEQSMQNELAAIKDQEKQALETYNTSKGVKKGDKGYTDTLPVEVQSTFDSLRVAAEQKKTREIEKINDDSAKEIQRIWKEVSAMFKSEQEKDVDTVNEKYDEIIKRAMEAGASEDALQSIYTQRKKELNELDIKYAMQRVDAEEEAAVLIANEKYKGVANETKLEREKLEIAKRFALQRVALLKKSGTEESKAEAAKIEKDINSIDEGLNKIKSERFAKGLGDASQIMGSMAGTASLISEELGKQVGAMADVAGSAANFAGNLSSGNWVGAVASGFELITSIATLFKGTDEQFVSATVKAQALKEITEEIRSLTTSVVSNPGAFANYLETQRQLVDDLKKSYESLSAQQVISLSSDDMISQVRDQISNLEREREFAEWDKNEERVRQLDAQIQSLEDEIAQLSSNPYEARYSDRIQYYLDLIQSQRDYIARSNLTESKLEAVRARIEEWQTKIEGIVNSYSEYISALEELAGFGSDELASSIVGGITDGLELAENGLGGFADSFQKHLQQAATKAMTNTFQSKYMESLLANFANAMNDGVLTSDERIDLEAQYRAAVEGMQGYFAAWEDLFGEADAQVKEGLKGEIKSVTETTASAIEGNINAILFNIVESKKTIDQQLVSLQVIRDNTSYNRYLVDIASTMVEMRKLQSKLNELLSTPSNPTSYGL